MEDLKRIDVPTIEGGVEYTFLHLATVQEIQVCLFGDFNIKVAEALVEIIKDYLNEVRSDYVIKNIISRISVFNKSNSVIDGYKGLFYHYEKNIKLLFDNEENYDKELLFFEEALIHEIRHAIFEYEVYKNENEAKLYTEYDIAIDLLNEYKAYSFAYKYMIIKHTNTSDITYLVNIFLDSITQFTEKKYDITTMKASDLHNLMNSLGRRLALIEINARIEDSKKTLRYQENKLIEIMSNLEYQFDDENLKRIERLIYITIS